MTPEELFLAIFGPRQRTTLRLARAVVIATILSSLAIPVGAAANDVLITDKPYVRHDGGTDPEIAACGNDATTPESGGDGAGNRVQNEPTVAINPLHPDVLAAGANDYCTAFVTGDDWMGFYVSTDGGETWTNSLNPGYPADTSTEGQASPIFHRAFGSGDPIMDWDNHDRLFYGGISYNRTDPNPSGRVTPTNGDVVVSTWEYRPATPLGLDYLRTVIVGQGTPSASFRGRFNDKPSLHVDDWPASPHEGNLYVAWTLYTGGAQDQILFSRSSDHGISFSKPIKLSKGATGEFGADVAVGPDGAVYVVWRRAGDTAHRVADAIVLVKSTNGGTTFGAPRTIATISPYDRSDRFMSGGDARDCGDGLLLCESAFVFARTGTLPQAAVSSAGNVVVTWEQTVPAGDDGNTYRPDGQARVVVSRSTNGGATWSTATAVDPQPVGHQWWPNVEFDRSAGTFALLYYDSRADPFYSVNRPPGNREDGTSSCGVPAPPDCDVLDTFIATSANGTSWSPAKVSAEGHQPEYETFDARNGVFQGDYLGVDAAGGRIFGVWTDNRDIVPGPDIREASQDGFDVLQCRANADASTPDTCPNAGGLNQNIYGASIP